MDEDSRISIKSLLNLTKRQVVAKLKQDFKRKDYRLTTDLLNLLYNIAIVGSVPASQVQRDLLDKESRSIWRLLSTKTSKAAKLQIFIDKPDLVITTAGACPDAGS